ncbi:Hsp70 family protein, partial [Acinetobacter baumannii]
SLVATVQSGLPRVLPDEQGGVLLPSVVRYLADGRVEVGETARQAAAGDALNTLVSVKRFMGRGVEAAQQLGEHLPYDLVAHDSGVPYF